MDERPSGAAADGPPPDDGWGPSIERTGRGRPRIGRLLLLVVLVLVALLIAGALLVSSQIPRQPVEGLTRDGRPLHVLVAGSDRRDSLTPEQQRELSTGSGELIGGERTDTIFVMTIEGGDVALLAFPRDLWVTRCDGTVGRINVAQSLDGPGCLVTTVRELSGLPISHYLGVDFRGFVDMVDAVDGVELCLDDAIRDQDAGIDLPEGCQVLDGREALGYVRVRKIDNDLQRIKRQQRFVQALARELTAPSTLLNPARLWAVAGSVGGAVSADDDLGVLELGRLAWGVRGMAAGNVPSYTVPATPGRTSGGAEVLYVEEAEAEALFARFRDGSVLEERNEEIAPADVQVVVNNGAGVSGLAGRFAELLSGRGYDVVGVGNADGRDETVVRHPPGAEASARRVLADLPTGVTIEESSDVTTVTVILGRDAAGLA